MSVVALQLVSLFHYVCSSGLRSDMWADICVSDCGLIRTFLKFLFVLLRSHIEVHV